MLGELIGGGYECAYTPRAPGADGDLWVAVRNGEILLAAGGGGGLPPFSLAPRSAEAQYLFAISGRGFFLADGDAPEGYQYKSAQALRALEPDWMALGAVTGMHLAYWYAHNRFCGACGAKKAHSGRERALICPECQSVVYPTVAPAVIVGVTDGDRLLLTKYAHGAYKRFALVAGFAEIGERLEDTVCREVYEETGLRVKNPRYYGSQPWGFSRSLLAGFFAELDGSDRTALRDGELSEAVWRGRGEIPIQESLFSLTSTMMEAFRTGRELCPARASDAKK